MANHSSALKRHRQNEKRRLRNKTIKSEIKTTASKVKAAIKGGNPEEAKRLLKSAVRLLDSAVTKGVLHRNNASRRISRLVSSLNSITQA